MLAMTLADGTKVPVPAYGVGTAWFKSGPGDLHREMIESVKNAISAGYTHFDNAEVYNNEEDFGVALKESQVDRRKLFITTKVLGGIKDVSAALKTSLKKMGLDHVDLYLIHSHNFADKPGNPSLKEAWGEMEKLKEAGLAKHIGVSNYRPEDLLKTLEGCKSPPEACQIEIHPHCYADAKLIIDTCQKHKIVMESYGPQVPLRNGMAPELEQTLEAIASELTESGVNHISGENGQGKVTPGQILLRWNYQLGSVPVTTSGKIWRMKEMLRIKEFELTSAQMEKINTAGGQKHYRQFGTMIGPFDGRLD